MTTLNEKDIKGYFNIEKEKGTRIWEITTNTSGGGIILPVLLYNPTNIFTDINNFKIELDTIDDMVTLLAVINGVFKFIPYSIVGLPKKIKVISLSHVLNISPFNGDANRIIELLEYSYRKYGRDRTTRMSWAYDEEKP